MFGVLMPEVDIDVTRSKEIIKLSHPLPVTFHRAFDMVQDSFVSLSILISLGVRRVLTCGQDSTALEGLPVLKMLNKQAGDKIIG